jgi:hypothetical protein
MQNSVELPNQEYEHEGIGRVRFLLYGILSAILQGGLVLLAMFIGGVNKSSEPSLPILGFIILVVLAGLVYGLYLIYARCKNIAINPWIGLCLTFLPIINIFWTPCLYLLPAGFWDDKRLDLAAKIWGAIIILLIIGGMIVGALLVPAIAMAVKEEEARLLQNQGAASFQNEPVLDENPFEQSYGMDTKCPNYPPTNEHFEKILNAIRSGNSQNSKMVLTDIAKNQGTLNPLIIGLAANLMVQRGQPEKALFWFYAGELRTLSDLNLYEDRERAGIFLQQYLGGDFNGGRVTALTPETRTQIELFIENNRDIAREQLKKALIWDQKTPKNYNRLWLGKEGAIPQTKWQQEDKKTRTKFQQSEIASIGVGPVESVFKPR